MYTITVTCENIKDLPAYKNAGADEILFAYKDNSFTALDSFSLDDLKQMKESCDSFNLKTAILMNRLYKEAEVTTIKDKLQFFKEIDVSSIWFADLAIAKIAKELKMLDKLVYMPGMSITSKLDAQFWRLEGFQSVVVSPFITKEEMNEIAENVQDVTALIHGRYAQSISYRNLVSAFVLNSKRNKTLSIQEESRDYNMPIYEDDFGTIIYTDYIQESFSEIKEFQTNGMNRFLITSMFCNRLSVFSAIRAYKEILNGKNEKQVEADYRKEFKDINLSDGFYGQATIK